MDWADRIGSRLKLRDLHILAGRRRMEKHGQSRKASGRFPACRFQSDRRSRTGVGCAASRSHAAGCRAHDLRSNRAQSRTRRFRRAPRKCKGYRVPVGPHGGRAANREQPAPLRADCLLQFSIGCPLNARGSHFKSNSATRPCCIIDDLRERNVDLLIGRVVELKEDDVNAEVLFEDRLYVVAGANNPWTRRRKIALKDLVHEPWTMPPLRLLCGRPHRGRLSGKRSGDPALRRGRLWQSVANRADCARDVF